MNSNYFECCREISKKIDKGEQAAARECLFDLLSTCTQSELFELPPVVCHLCRLLGLFQYLSESSADWRDAIAKYAFEVNAGGDEIAILHIEQSKILKLILQGSNIALSAPTSFGKSFIIDAYIAIKKPKNVVLIVPTVALMDEARRRLSKKFSSEYSIITFSNEQLSNKNIFIFPQERVFSYLETFKRETIDMLIVDEFYKASSAKQETDSRVTTLQKAITELAKNSRQRYYLMPNIQTLDITSPLMKGMEFCLSDFNTVKLRFHNTYEEYSHFKTRSTKEKYKFHSLMQILCLHKKTLIYAGTVNETNKVAEHISDNFLNYKNSALVQGFSDWLKNIYGEGFYLVNCIQQGCGIHNGILHRSLCQIQVSLFAEPNGLDTIVSTSSIIEGVNTSAENVVLWTLNISKHGNIDYFTYKNISGRAGRMFRYFVGDVYNLVKPPSEEFSQLELDYTDDCTLKLSADEIPEDLPEDKSKMVSDFFEQARELGCDMSKLKDLLYHNGIKVQLFKFLNIIEEMRDSNKWKDIEALNIPIKNKGIQSWKRTLGYILFQKMKQHLQINIKFEHFIPYIIYASRGLEISPSSIITEVNAYTKTAYNNNKRKLPTFDYDMFFRAEKHLIYDFSAMLNDFNNAYNLTHDSQVNIAPFLARLANAFLPAPIYQLEEFGLPRYLSKKIFDSQAIDLCSEGRTIKEVVADFKSIGFDALAERINTLSSFERYVLKCFYDGI